MSSPYPSRRELRLQRERERRAQVSEPQEHARSEAAGQAPRDPELGDASTTQTDTVDQEAVAAEPTADSVDEVAQDAPELVDDSETEEESTGKAPRRADSAVTSTGMLPIISKPVVEQTTKRPRSRREARELQARQTAERSVQVDRLQRQQDETIPTKPARRASSPQFSPAPTPVPAILVAEVTDTTPVANIDSAVDQQTSEISFTDSHEPTAAEITNIGGLDTIEIRRAELRAETEQLTREIIELGEDNPNVIDPQLLRRQKELADKSRELQELETAAIEIVESNQSDASATLEASEDPVAEEQNTDASEQDEPEQRVSRRGRRTSQTEPFMTGPFSVDDETPQAAAAPKPSINDFLHPGTSKTTPAEPRQPIDATAAHGLDTLDAKDVEATERRIIISAIVMFAIGLIALIVAIILLSR